MSLSTHVLDLSSGLPAADVEVSAERKGEGWMPAGAGRTDEDGRIADLIAGPLSAGSYRITFDSGAYYAASGIDGFYPEVVINFEVADRCDHLHVPLLLSPYGYSTYRGS